LDAATIVCGRVCTRIMIDNSKESVLLLSKVISIALTIWQ